MEYHITIVQWFSKHIKTWIIFVNEGVICFKITHLMFLMLPFRAFQSIIWLDFSHVYSTVTCFRIEWWCNKCYILYLASWKSGWAGCNAAWSGKESSIFRSEVLLRNVLIFSGKLFYPNWYLEIWDLIGIWIYEHLKWPRITLLFDPWSAFVFDLCCMSLLALGILA